MVDGGGRAAGHVCQSWLISSAQRVATGPVSLKVFQVSLSYCKY